MQEIVKYHNDLNKIKLPKFTEIEQDLLMGILVQVKNGNNKIELYPQDFKFTKKNYTDKELGHILYTLRNKLFKADFMILVEDKKRGLVGEEYVNLFKKFVLWYDTYSTLDANILSVTLEINPEFAYLVEQLTANFTRFELAEFIALSGKYTKTLYRLLKQYRQTGYMRMEWDEFKRILDIPEKLKMCDIDKDILKPAIKELTAERNLFDRARIPFKDLSYTKIKGNGRGRGGNVIAIEFRFKPEQVQKELESRERIAENLKNHIPTSDDYNAKQEFENYKGVEIFFYDSNNHPINAEIKDFDNGTNQLICYDKKTKQDFKIPFENLQKANKWITEKLQGIV